MIELTYGIGDRPVGCFRAAIHQLRETGPDDTPMDLGQEQTDDRWGVVPMLGISSHF